VRDFQIEHHDGDDDGDDAIAEGGKTIFFHWWDLFMDKANAQQSMER
jgi:hypothetical protein